MVGDGGPEALQRLEAILILAREPLPTRKLAQLAGLADGTEARTLVRTLNRQFDAKGYAFRVEEVAGGWQMLSRAEFAPWLRRLQPMPVEVRLSPPALETLAVVAYRQPALRAQIEAIRGVQCGEILRQLIERDLVRIVGRSEDLGRPLLYGTTRLFLQVFGLRHLDELPRPAAFGGAAGSQMQTDRNNDPTCSDKELVQREAAHSQQEEAQVKTSTTHSAAPIGLLDESLTKSRFGRATRLGGSAGIVDAFKDEEEDGPDEEEEDDDDLGDDDFDDEDDDFEEDDEEDEELDDDDLEDDEWEEVDDDDEDLDDEDDEWEDDLDDDDDDDWDDDDEDEEEEEGEE